MTRWLIASLVLALATPALAKPPREAARDHREAVDDRHDLADDALDWIPVVINRKMADELFRGEDPLGQVVHEEPEWRVVGVVDNFRRSGELGKIRPFFLTRISLRQPEQTSDGQYSIPERFLITTR